MFDFVSPFDALSSTSTTSSVKKKPVPSAPTGTSSGDDTWTTGSMGADPKRKSIENLMDQLTMGGQVPQQQPLQPPLMTDPPHLYNPYGSHPADDYSQTDLLRGAGAPPPPLPPKPPRVPSPPRTPPKSIGRSGYQQAEPTVQAPIGRNQESSPGPRSGNWKSSGQEGRAKGASGKSKNQGASSTSQQQQPQSIVFDVSQPHSDIQASPELIKSTAIALVKQDPVFLPGTTIGVTQWVAYAMTRGRVRVISRLSGDRTLLQLPGIFPSSTSIIDMAVYGNRLAGVTSDGGFVVWELPNTITDDVP